MIVRALSLLAIAALLQTSQPPAMRDENATLRGRLAGSVAVVVGKVVDSPHRLPWRGPGGEHTPDWWAAPVRVSSTLSGERQKGVIQVAFAYAYENTWEASPKLRPGEEAIFLLHRFERKEMQERAHNALEVPPVEGFLVIDPQDVQPLSGLERIQTLLKTMRTSR